MDIAAHMGWVSGAYQKSDSISVFFRKPKQGGSCDE